MREYTTLEVEGIVRTEMKSDLENLIREGRDGCWRWRSKLEVAEYVKEHGKSERGTWTMGKMSRSFSTHCLRRMTTVEIMTR